MSDNPFSEPEDSDRTVVRGPTRAATPIPAAAPAVPPGFAPAMPAGPTHRMAGEAETLPKIGLGPLSAAAGPLLDLLSRLVANVQVPNPAELRERAVRALRSFEAEARAAEVSPDEIRAAHYGLCAAIDDVAMATPWGQQSGWSAHSLVSTFHQEVKAGDRFFDLLAGMQKDPGRYRQALEVAYLCLALGLQGRYRLSPRGAAELDRIREGLYQLLVQLRGPYERELSPHWRGVDAPHRRAGRSVPSWVAGALALAVLGIGYAGLANSLSGRSEDLFARLAALPPGALPTIQRTAPPVPPAPPPPAPAPSRPDLQTRLRQFLAPEIQQGLVTVLADPNRVIVRIRNRGMFASGSASLDPRFRPLLNRIGEALRDEPGAVQILGHSDNQPIRTARFPSNYHLSTARAQAAQDVIATATGGDRARFSAEGRGESEPVAANATAEGREENRRIEVVVNYGRSR
ncbi:type VI secretion system protein TssL, long form [Belnapia rosea]|uniref:type VI secretion system protein TssL, long form n=1 Tax=Belnapia rosea TaxID=938405 RepID=UPI00087F31DB|nr:type VI secretion system protein TssL, long form [Belnapia rosea]SDB68279.1 type VI secretion system protein ImpK [Belnapia rosea]